MSIHSAPLSEINLPSSSYEISGELPALKPFVSGINDRLQWAWDASYIGLEPYKARQKSATATASSREVTRKRDYVFTVPGALVVPIGDKSQNLMSNTCQNQLSCNETLIRHGFLMINFLLGLGSCFGRRSRSRVNPSKCASQHMVICQLVSFLIALFQRKVCTIYQIFCIID